MLGIKDGENHDSQQNNNLEEQKEESYRDENNGEENPNDVSLKPEDLEAVAVLYDCIRDLHKEQDQDSDKVLAEQFDTHVRNVMSDLCQKLNTRADQLTMQGHVLKAKYALYEICFSKTIEYIGNIEPRLSSILEGIHDAHALIFKDMNAYFDITVNELFFEIIMQI